MSSSSRMWWKRAPGTRVLGHGSFHGAGAGDGMTPPATSPRASFRRPKARGPGTVGSSGAPGGAASRRPERSMSTRVSSSVPRASAPSPSRASSAKGSDNVLPPADRRASSASAARPLTCRARRAAGMIHVSLERAGSCGRIASDDARHAARADVSDAASLIGRKGQQRSSRPRETLESSRRARLASRNVASVVWYNNAPSSSTIRRGYRTISSPPGRPPSAPPRASATASCPAWATSRSASLA